jgi:hypothetical protein
LPQSQLKELQRLRGKNDRSTKKPPTTRIVTVPVQGVSSDDDDIDDEGDELEVGEDAASQDDGEGDDDDQGDESSQEDGDYQPEGESDNSLEDQPMVISKGRGK